MINSLLNKLFGTRNDRLMKEIWPIIYKINEMEPKYKKMSNDDLKAQTANFKQRIANGESLDSLLMEAFAVTRETASRVLGQRHYDVQLIGGLGLHRGMISEMKTGEGKTLTSTGAIYLNALSGKGVHVITVNDYLARRDAAWMGGIYHFHNLSVGSILHGINDRDRRTAYHSDITYGTNNEFGFDFLRDNMKHSLQEMVQRELNFAIVDEVDSILIDEARTPLIISGPSEDSTDKYYIIDKLAPSLQKDVDYTLDEKAKSASLTDEGVNKVEKKLNVQNLYDPRHIELVHHVNQALRAHTLFKRDVDYVVKDGEIVIVDEFTGRLMPGRRWSDGLHQAIEAKEGVKIEGENQTLATITFQNYFRMYNKLAGMTGTADTEAAEFKKIYNLDVLLVPTNKTCIRKDFADQVYKSEAGKFRAVVNTIEDCHKRGQPALVGTISIEKSERLSAMLKKKGIPHNVLNAKQHSREADIIAQAGRKGAITISTNMAGRGTDILLGGNAEYLTREKLGVGFDVDANQDNYKKTLADFKAQCEKEKAEVANAGGLIILGTERHESRRIDNQLRGRAGRQGDPGASKFFLSLEDDLMRIFGSDRISKMMDTLGMEEDEPIEHNLVTRAIENAQKRVEGHNFDIRKHLLEYDDVMNQQRKVIYGWRRDVLNGKDLRQMTISLFDDLAAMFAFDYASQFKKATEWNFQEINENCMQIFRCPFELQKEDIKKLDGEGLSEAIAQNAIKYYGLKETNMGEGLMRELEKFVSLTSIDQSWKDHLLQMDHLREGISLRGYAQKDPLLEYKKEAFRTFEEMIDALKTEIVQKMFAVQVAREEEIHQAEEEAKRRENANKHQLTSAATVQPQVQAQAQAEAPKKEEAKKGDAYKERQHQADHSEAVTNVRVGPKVGRNDPCPCGSGKKFKQCCGK